MFLAFKHFVLKSVELTLIKYNKHAYFGVFNTWCGVYNAMHLAISLAYFRNFKLHRRMYVIKLNGIKKRTLKLKKEQASFVDDYGVFLPFKEFYLLSRA